MNLSGSVVFAALFVFVVVSADEKGLCRAYDESDGECVKLSNCKVLLDMLIGSNKKRSLSHNEAIQIIQKSSCGFVAKEPVVCCPEVKEKLDNVNQDNTMSDDTIELSPSNLPPLFHAPPQTEASSTPFLGSSNTPPATNYPATEKPSEPSSPKVEEDKTTSATSQSPTEPITSSYDEVSEKYKLLPEECGRVLTFKFFQGNQTELDDFPWATLVEYKTPSGNKFACGGSLISNRYVLTAAHCVSGLPENWSVASVRFGEYDTSSELDCLLESELDNSTYCADAPVNVEVEEAIVYPGFLSTDRLHDIALLRLKKEINFTGFIKPICLPSKAPILQRYYTSGWSSDSNREGRTNLKYMSYVRTVQQKICQEKYKSKNIVIFENQMCGGSITDKPCIGDGGGSLMGIEIRGNYNGVAAFGVLSRANAESSKCENGGAPAIYTKVIDYVPWILSRIRT